MSGRLQIVATPIGNLDDLSARARSALEHADLIACEDTRRTGLLLQHLGFKRRLVSLHEHNEARRVPELIGHLREGRTIALVADAGTPLLCDPGYVLVREAIRSGIQIEAVPGPSALLAALVTSGLPPYPFTFGGFVPRRRGRRAAFFRALGNLGHTLVLYESPHRVSESLGDAVRELGGDRPAVLVRELTKLHEEVLRGTLAEVAAALADRSPLKGEIVLVLGGDGRRPSGDPAANEESLARPPEAAGEDGTTTADPPHRVNGRARRRSRRGA